MTLTSPGSGSVGSEIADPHMRPKMWTAMTMAMTPTISAAVEILRRCHGTLFPDGLIKPGF